MTLLNALESKSKDVVFIKLKATYDAFYETVAPQLNYTLRIFGEYTPHDINIHINNLFRIADRILGDEIINSLNATECFILCCSLVGHDWGMAISERKRFLSLIL